jgi:2-phospho-L-lactate guanylyltransferase (CobY/MobA/RfbA family)
MATPFDTLKLARRLEAAGFPPQQAGDMAEAIAEAVSQLATKADIAILKADLAALQARIDAKLEILKRDMTIRLGSMMVVAVGVILAGFKLIH